MAIAFNLPSARRGGQSWPAAIEAGLARLGGEAGARARAAPIRLGVIMSLRAEADCLRWRDDAAAPLTYVTGGSPARARIGAELLRAKGAAGLVSFGLAIGLAPVLRPGDVVIADRVVMPGGGAVADRSGLARGPARAPRRQRPQPARRAHRRQRRGPDLGRRQAARVPDHLRRGARHREPRGRRGRQRRRPAAPGGARGRRAVRRDAARDRLRRDHRGWPDPQPRRDGPPGQAALGDPGRLALHQERPPRARRAAPGRRDRPAAVRLRAGLSGGGTRRPSPVLPGSGAAPGAPPWGVRSGSAAAPERCDPDDRATRVHPHAQRAPARAAGVRLVVLAALCRRRRRARPSCRMRCSASIRASPRCSPPPLRVVLQRTRHLDAEALRCARRALDRRQLGSATAAVWSASTASGATSSDELRGALARDP